MGKSFKIKIHLAVALLFILAGGCTAADLTSTGGSAVQAPQIEKTERSFATATDPVPTAMQTAEVQIPPIETTVQASSTAMAAADPKKTLTTVPSAPVLVPLGSPPDLDGRLSPGEWDEATVETFADGSELLLMYADGDLYLGIRANTPGMIAGNILVLRGNEIAILHASAALGTAIYQRGEDNWQQTQDFTWHCRSTGQSAAAREERDAFLQQEGWLAANSRMGAPEEMEYRIELAEGILNLAVNFIHASDPSVKIPWPTGLEDDSIMPTPGGLPPEMQFSRKGGGCLR